MMRPKCFGGNSIRIFCAAALLSAAAAGAQTLATGDGRGTVTEPTFPTAFCSKVAAETTVTSAGEPASETADTQIQAALTAAATGSCKTASPAVELTLNSNGNDAFVIKPIAIPSGVTLVVDGGVTVFGSLNAADYQYSGSTDTCGVNGTLGTGCNALIYLGEATAVASAQSSSTNSALMGYGVINGRGGDVPVVTVNGVNQNNTSSWWQLSNIAQNSGTAPKQNNPVMVQLYHATNAVMYKITLINGPKFHVRNSGNGGNSTGAGFTVWGLKIITPWSTRNTDGVDPTGVLNMTVANSVIGDGDDEIAISGSTVAQGYSLNNLLLPSGHGVSIGSITTNGVSNVVANGLYFSGQPTDGNQAALKIKSYCSMGGAVSNVTYQNVCVQNVTLPLDLDTNYSGSGSGTSACPAYSGVTYQNVHVLNSPSLTHPLAVNLQGLSSASAAFTFNNVVFDQTPSVGTPQYDTINGAGPVYPSSLATLSGTGVTYTQTPTVSNANALACPSSGPTNVFPAMTGELFVSTAALNNVNTATTLTNPVGYTLHAMLEPVNSQASYTTGSSSYTGVAAPSGSVQFYDNGVALGAPVTLSANNTLTSYTVTNPGVGQHVYTAVYGNDTNYPNGLSLNAAAPSGGEAQALTITVNAGAASRVGITGAPAGPITYGNGPGTVTAAIQDGAGDTVTSSTASVMLTVTGPNNYSHAYTVNAVNGVATFNSLAVLPGVGSYTYTATSGVLANATAGESVTAATLTVTGNPASRVFGSPNPSFTATIAGYVNGDGAGVVSGSPTFSTTAVRSSPVVAGGYPITVGAGTLSAANYTFSTSSGTLTITGNAPQVVNFLPLAGFAHGGSYQLAATASSGLAVAYTVSGGGASVSGATLTLPSGAAGQTITVTASQAGNTSYAAATNAMQSFVAQ
jgi:polygalacturonase